MIFPDAGSTAPAVDAARGSWTAPSAPRASLPAADGTDDAIGVEFATHFATQILDRLFHLLKRRLGALTLDCSGESGQAMEHSPAQIMNARIWECAASLDHMRAALGPDIARLCQTERELLRTRIALLQMHRPPEETRSAPGRSTAAATRAVRARPLGPTVGAACGESGNGGAR